MDASWILIGWRGLAEGGATRSEAEAAALAAQIKNDLDHGADVAALAKRHSDHPSGKRGGRLGTLTRGSLTPELEAALQSVAPFRATSIRTSDGWVVLFRHPPRVASVRWAAWGYKGAARSTIGRSKEAAIALAAEASRAGLADGAGDLRSEGVEAVGPGQWPPALDEALWALGEGATSDPIVTDAGVYVLKRP